jgi:ubiquinone biosynthesis protein Coq4
LLSGWAEVVAGQVDLMASALQEHWQQHHATYHVLGNFETQRNKTALNISA